MASEILATRWTPLILRELMTGQHGFNDIHRGIPLISRALLASRLRELEHHGIIERRERAGDRGHEYWLTEAGNAFRAVVDGLGNWGLAHARDRVRDGDLDPLVLLWDFRKRVSPQDLPEERVVVRFEFSGVPASRSKYRVLWLILDRAGADICAKDPGHPTSAVFRGHVGDFVKVYLGHAPWHEMKGGRLRIEGEPAITDHLPRWLKLDRILGHDMPVIAPVPRPGHGAGKTAVLIPAPSHDS